VAPPTGLALEQNGEVSRISPFFGKKDFWRSVESRGKAFWLDHVSMVYENVSAFAFYLDHDFDWFYPFDNISVYQISACLATLFNPLAVSDLALEPFSTCEASVFLDPSRWLWTQDYWAEIDSSPWLRTEHVSFWRISRI
jgi:hypothetical protein